MSLFAKTYILTSLAMYLITFAVYRIDKRRAKTGGRRISEATLHWLAFFGGWPGAWAGQQFFRHKTQKLAFGFIFWSIAVLHLTLIVAYFLLSSTR